MTIRFKKYEESNFSDLVECMEKLQDFLVKIDPLRRERRLAGYGNRHTNNLTRKVNMHGGLILLAYDKKGKVVGFIAGALEKQTRDNLLAVVPTKFGRILELFVHENYRNRGIGKELMNRVENYFRRNGCSVIKAEVFEPNKGAYNFYRTLDYQDRTVDMIKLLE